MVDLRELRYSWGGDLDIPAGRLRRGRMPVLTVVGPQSFDAFAGVIDPAELRTDVETALAEVESALRALR